MAGRI